MCHSQSGTAIKHQNQITNNDDNNLGRMHCLSQWISVNDWADDDAVNAVDAVDDVAPGSVFKLWLNAIIYEIH